MRAHPQRPRAGARAQQFDDLLFFGVLGVILGGRLGYVLFYKPGYYPRIRSRSSRSGRAACRSTAACSA